MPESISFKIMFFLSLFQTVNIVSKENTWMMHTQMKHSVLQYKCQDPGCFQKVLKVSISLPSTTAQVEISWHLVTSIGQSSKPLDPTLPTLTLMHLGCHFFQKWIWNYMQFVWRLIECVTAPHTPLPMHVHPQIGLYTCSTLLSLGWQASRWGVE